MRAGLQQSHVEYAGNSQGWNSPGDFRSFEWLAEDDHSLNAAAKQPLQNATSCSEMPVCGERSSTPALRPSRSFSALFSKAASKYGIWPYCRPYTVATTPTRKIFVEEKHFLHESVRSRLGLEQTIRR